MVPAPIHSRPHSATSPRRTVLIADDSRFSRAVLGSLLTDNGYRVIEAADGNQVFDLLQDETPDLFLLDVVMPEVDGRAVCRKLKQDTYFSAAPVIFITSRTAPEDIVAGFEAGAVDYITKPFHMTEVLARVRTHIALYRALVEIDRLRELALDASPLTQLPGNHTISAAVQSAIDRNDDMAVIYCDLDSFKAYNDRYSFSDGDRLLQFTADTLRRSMDAVCGKAGFLGHIGGDDFVLMVPSVSARAVGHRIKSLFDAGARAHYSDEDCEAGYITSKDRQGRSREFAFVSISMAGVYLDQRDFECYAQVSTVCTEVKKRAKAMEGSALVFDRRSSLLDDSRREEVVSHADERVSSTG